MDTTGAEVIAEFQRIAGELTEGSYDGNVRAIACVFINTDGDVCTRIAFGLGTKMPLLAGTAILQHEMMQKLEFTTAKPSNRDAASYPKEPTP